MIKNFFYYIRDKLRSVDEVVPVLVFFELIYLAVGEAIIWIFLPINKPAAALGFLIGIGFAMASSIQNAMVLKRALESSKKRRAAGRMILALLIRVACICLVIVAAVITKFCNPIAILIGVLAIQAGVYFEPMVRKRRLRAEAAYGKEKGKEAISREDDSLDDRSSNQDAIYTAGSKKSNIYMLKKGYAHPESVRYKLPKRSDVKTDALDDEQEKHADQDL